MNTNTNILSKMLANLMQQYKKEHYSTTKKGLSSEWKVDSTYEIQLMNFTKLTV